MKKQEILIELADALQRLIMLLSLDSSSIWIDTFRGNFEVATRMLGEPLDFVELARLSTSIRHVYGGVGSFNDYEPSRFDPLSGRYVQIAGTEEFDVLRRQVYDLAIELIAADT